jgi:hypothetical protein
MLISDMADNEETKIKWPPASPEQQKKRAKFWLVK